MQRTVEKIKVGDTYWALYYQNYTNHGISPPYDVIVSHWCLNGSTKRAYPYAGETATCESDLLSAKLKCKWCGELVPDKLLFLLRMCEIHG